jgi:hypothetical protein
MGATLELTCRLESGGIALDGDRYFLSPLIRMLREIHNMIRPEPKREPLPEPKRYEPPSAGRYRRRG